MVLILAALATASVKPGALAQKQKLTASDGTTGDFFGYSVSLSGDRVLVGAQWDDEDGNRSGSAYVFERVGGTWVEQQKLTASDGGAVDDFGRAVSLSSDQALIGTPGDDDRATNAGAAYVYELDLGSRRYVAITGSDAGNDCADALNPCATLAHAVDQADPGDIINLAAGTYNEAGLLVEKSLIIEGAGVVAQ